MISIIKTWFCKHEIVIIEDYEWVKYWGYEPTRELRKYMICKKCGFKKKVSKK